MTNPDQDILKFFQAEHLPKELARIADAVRGVALWMGHTLPPNPERREGLRRLLEAKDCFVRSQLSGEAQSVTISKETFDRLQAAADWLKWLEAAGVDNWEGCDHAATLKQEANNEPLDV